MREIIDKYKDVVVQIATPLSTGTGFYLAEYNLIVTNEHVVRGSKEVVIDGNAVEKSLTDVLFVDPVHDLAFLALPDKHEMKSIDLAAEKVNDGDPVIAIGHPMGLKYTTTQGIVSNASRHIEHADLNYIQIDAAINPGNSGGPLVNDKGEVIGVNTFIFRDSNNLGFALPSNYLAEVLKEYKENHGKKGGRCTSCSNLVFEDTVDEGYCPHCGAKIKLITDLDDYEPTGIPHIVENIVKNAGHDVRLSRRGPNFWEIEQGSAKIRIAYNAKNGLLFGDAVLCKLPKQNIKEVYEYLLRQNHTIENMGLSINKQNIILSLLIYDRYLNEETGQKLFKDLFDKADHYDDILVDQYGARWHEEED